MPKMVEELLHQFLDLWWGCDTSVPLLGPTYTPRQKLAAEKRLGREIDALVNKLESLPRTNSNRQAVQERIIASAGEIAKTTFGLEDRHLGAIRGYGFLDVLTAFAQMARLFDPAVDFESIYQASRNVWSMNIMQLFMGLPMQLTPSIFAYSMLYPYTDNYLDDPATPEETKLAFNQRFRSRLEGETVIPVNAYEEKIYNLVGMVEGQFERTLYPQVYESLLAIHRAQWSSLSLIRRDASPYEVDVLALSFEKGGSSVLADGYLISGTLTPEQRELMFHYGAFTQLMDDLEDVQQDRQNGILTVFSQTAGRWPLDAVTNRTFHFGAGLLERLDAIEGDNLAPLKDTFNRAIMPLLIISVGSLGRFYTRDYRRGLEVHLPFRYSFLEEQRKKLNRRKLSLVKMSELLLESIPAAVH